MVLDQIFSGVQTALSGFGFDVVSFAPNLVLAIILLLIGLLLGKLSKWILKKIIMSPLKLTGTSKIQVVDTFLIIVKWAIYIVFIQASIVSLKIPGLSDYLSTALGIIPGIVGSVLVLIVGYGIGSYLKNGFSRLGMESGKPLGNLLFVFVIFVSVALAIRSSLSWSEELSNNIILAIASIGFAVAAWNYVSGGNFRKSSRGSSSNRIGVRRK